MVSAGKGWCGGWHSELRVGENNLLNYTTNICGTLYFHAAKTADTPWKPLVLVQKGPDWNFLASSQLCHVGQQLPQVLFQQMVKE